MIDVIEWVWTLANAAGVVLLGIILEILYAYRRTSQGPGQNGRPKAFARILLRFGWVCMLIHVVFVLSGVAAILRPNPIQEQTLAGVVAILFALAFDITWLLSIRDFGLIRGYRSRVTDK
jgi:hypothetical protein